MPFHSTVAPLAKFVPFTVSVNAPPRAAVSVGLMVVMVGTGLLTVNVADVAVGPPPGAGFETVTGKVPADDTSEAVSVAVN